MLNNEKLKKVIKFDTIFNMGKTHDFYIQNYDDVGFIYKNLKYADIKQKISLINYVGFCIKQHKKSLLWLSRLLVVLKQNYKFSNVFN